EKLKQDVRILMDIAGPKIRTDWVFTHLSKPKVSAGDKIRITRDYESLPPSDVNFSAGCKINEIYEQIELEQPVLFDDGNIEVKVDDKKENEFILEVLKTKGSSKRVKADMGLIFPKNNFTFDSLDEKDKNDIAFACQHADIIGCSFVNRGRDIQLIQEEIEKVLGKDAKHMGL